MAAHADGPLIPPDMFVQIAEAADLAQALTWRVIERRAPPHPCFRTCPSINLPPVSLTGRHVSGSGDGAPRHEP